MANASLFMDVLAHDNASAVFNKIGASAAALGKRTDRVSRSHQTFGKMVRWTGGILSVYGIGQYLKSSMQEYAKAEAAQNRLGNSYKRFPRMQNATLQSFRDLNKELMLHTQFDDDDAAAMQANLGRFALTGKQIQKLTPLVADLAQVQGTDLVSAGSALGKAFLGNTRALKALGISYTATGNKAKDYRRIVDLVNQKVGGESTKANQTAAVKLKMLENQWGELKETVGQAVLPAFNKLVAVAGPAITELGAAVQRNMPQIEQTFEDVWRAASKFGGALKDIWDGFSSMPTEVRNVLLALAGGTWALGKVKGSALGTGVSSLFSGLKTITAGNVTVVGKTVTGPGMLGGRTKTNPSGPWGPRTYTTAGIASLIGPVLLGTTVAAAIAVAIKAGIDNVQGGDTPTTNRNRQSDFRNSNLGRGSQRGEGMGYRSEREQMRGIAKAAGEAADEAGRLVTRIRLLPKPAKEAAAEANKFAAAAAKAAQVKQAKITLKGAKQAAAEATDVANRIKRIQNKDAKITARSARKAAADAVLVATKIKAIPNKDAKVTVNNTQAIIALAQVTSAMAVLQSKTIYLDVVRRESGGNSGGAGEGATLAGARPRKPKAPGTDATKEQKAAYKRQMSAYERDLAYWQTEQDAKRQQRMSRYITSNFLSDNEADWLTGLDPKVARRFMKHPKRLRRFARMASSVSDTRAERDAWRSRNDAATQRARDALNLKERKELLAKLAADKEADLLAEKRPAKRARLYAELQDLDEQLAAANAAMAEAEVSAQESVRAAIEETASSYRSFASIATLITDDVTAAQDKLVAAQDAVTEARRKFDLAGNDRDRAAAARELADAERNAAEAQKARNDVTDKPTSSSIRANMAGKLSKLKGFAAAVKQLKANGLNATTLADILSMGPDQGYDYAKALLDGGLADINAVQADITAESANLGLFSAGVNSAAATAAGIANAMAGGLNVSLVPAPVTLNLDGRAIATALLEYNRQSGR